MVRVFDGPFPGEYNQFRGARPVRPQREKSKRREFESDPFGADAAATTPRGSPRPMIRPFHRQLGGAFAFASLAAWLWIAFGLSGPRTSRGDEPAAARNVAPGRFFTIDQPIDSGVNESVQAAVDAFIRDSAARGERPVLVFEFRPGSTTSFGAAYELAEYLSSKPKTVAYVPEPLSGYAVLGVLACDEIVMGKDASLGPIAPEGRPVKPTHVDFVRQLAKRKERDPDLFLGMLDREADLREVRAADRTRHFVLKSNRAEFEKTHKIVDDQPAWEAGRLGIVTAERREAWVCRN